MTFWITTIAKGKARGRGFRFWTKWAFNMKLNKNDPHHHLPQHISSTPPSPVRGGVVQEARLCSPLRLKWISWRMVSPSSPGWIAPLKPANPSVILADTGAGCPPLALLLLDVTRTEPQVKDSATQNLKKREREVTLFFFSFSFFRTGSRQLPSHHGF